MTDIQKDRREFVRVPFDTTAEIHIDGRVVRATGAIDVSMNSLRIAADCKDFPPGLPCSAKIFLAASGDGITIEARGAVTRCEGGTLVMRFSELDLDSFHHLRQLILYNTEEPEKAEEQFASHWGLKLRDPKEGSQK
jgi:hypothetical protein